MLKQLLELFSQPQAVRNEHSLAMASAALLVEIMRADHEIDQHEQRTITNALQQSLKLSDAQAVELLQEATQLTDASNDLHQFTKVINTNHNDTEKAALLTNLWRVAYASDGLDKYEEHMIRKIAELLYIPHSEFIRTKLLARDENTAP